MDSGARAVRMDSHCLVDVLMDNWRLGVPMDFVRMDTGLPAPSVQTDNCPPAPAVRVDTRSLTGAQMDTVRMGNWPPTA